MLAQHAAQNTLEATGANFDDFPGRDPAPALRGHATEIGSFASCPDRPGGRRARGGLRDPPLWQVLRRRRRDRGGPRARRWAETEAALPKTLLVAEVDRSDEAAAPFAAMSGACGWAAGIETLATQLRRTERPGHLAAATVRGRRRAKANRREAHFYRLRSPPRPPPVRRCAVWRRCSDQSGCSPAGERGHLTRQRGGQTGSSRSGLDRPAARAAPRLRQPPALPRAALVQQLRRHASSTTRSTHAGECRKLPQHRLLGALEARTARPRRLRNAHRRLSAGHQ
jgi:hypothetical protein